MNLTRLLRNSLFSNAIYLMGGRFGSTALIFVYWALVARTTGSQEIGQAVTANSAISVLIVLSDLGLGSGMVRFAGKDQEQASRVVNVGVAAGWIASITFSVIFLLGIPLWSPGLAVLLRQPGHALGFMLYTAAWNVLNLQAAALLSRRLGSFSFWRFTIVSLLAILTYLVLHLFLDGFTAVFISYNLPNILLLLASSASLLPRRLPGYRFFGSLHIPTVGHILRFTSTNHLATILWQLPVYLMPLLATNLISAEAAAFFYMPWIIGNTVLTIPQLVSLSLFAEGSLETHALSYLIRRASLLIALIITPVVVVLWIAGGWVLALLGKDYVNLTLLRLILASALPYSINTIIFTYARVQMKLRLLVVQAALLAALILVLVTWLIPVQGVNGIAVAWLAGHAITAFLIGGYLLARR